MDKFKTHGFTIAEVAAVKSKYPQWNTLEVLKEMEIQEAKQRKLQARAV